VLPLSALLGAAFLGRHFEFETNICLDHTELVPINLRIDEQALTYPVTYDDDERPDLHAVIQRAYSDGETLAWACKFVGSVTRGQTGHVLMTLCYAIHEGFRYTRRTDGKTQIPEETLYRRMGTCRDFALLTMEAARSLGFAARFVTGYVYVPDRGGSRTLGGGSTHAWCQVYLPGAGWVEFDPTNGIVGNRELIRVAVARDPRQAVPLSGSYDGGADDFLDMTVQVNVTIA